MFPQYFILGIYLNLLATMRAFTNVTYSSILRNQIQYNQTITGNGFINIVFQVTSSPNFTYTMVDVSFIGFIDPQPSISSFYGINPINKKSYDLEGVAMGHRQYINLIKPTNASQLYITLYNYDNASFRKNFVFNLNISETNGLVCQPCVSGSLIVSPISCYCSQCSFGYQGYDCSRKIVYVSYNTVQSFEINGYQPLYLRVSGSTQNYILNFLALVDNVNIYIRTISYAGQFANYFNVDVISQQQQKFSLTPQSQMTLSYPAIGSDLSITVVKYSQGVSSISMQYSTVVTDHLTYILTIVVGIVSGIAFITLIGVLYIIWKKIKNNRLVNNNPDVIRRQHAQQLLNSNQINKYFPQVRLNEISISQSSDQSQSQIPFQNTKQPIKEQSLSEKQCVICLEGIKIDEKIRVTYCRHFFHSDCLMNWFKKQSSCPYCRCNFTIENTQILYENLLAELQQKRLKGKELVRAIIRLNQTIIQEEFIVE